MREDKKKRLEAKGWKIGGVKDLLGLSDEELAYIELKLKLGHSLKAKREERRLTQIALAWVFRPFRSPVPGDSDHRFRSFRSLIGAQRRSSSL